MFILTNSNRLLLARFNKCFKMPVFTQKLNPILGESTWEWQDENYDYQQEIARSSFADMLHDNERNQKYYDAIKVAVDKMHETGRKANVLDIGTGTGLLSMMAVRCGADSVVACEAFLPMSSCAQNIIDLNECGGKIKIVPKHSTDLTVGEGGDLPERANILVTEVFDTELIGEGALATFNHARAKLLDSSCIVVPHCAIIYAQVIESSLVCSWNEFKDICNDGECLLQAPSAIKNCHGAAAVHDIQLSQLKRDCFKEVFPPAPVVRFDWAGGTPISFTGRYDRIIKAECDGTAQVVFMWWELHMDVDEKIVLSCAPFWAHPLKVTKPNLTSVDVPWRDHWMQAVYYLPKEEEVKKGDELTLVTSHDEFSLWFNLDSGPVRLDDPYVKPICECGFHIAHSRTRIGQLNDERRNKSYLALMKKYVNAQSVVLLISEGFYLGLVAAKLGAKKVLCLDDNYMSTKVFKEFVKFNGLSNVEVVGSIDDLTSNESIRDINLVLGQPHFSTTILPWDSLYFAYLVRRVRGLIAEDAVVAPRVASIKGVVVEFNDLQKIRLPLESCGEFDMKPFDDLIMDSINRCDASIEAQPLWEYPCIARSPVKEVAKLDLEGMFQASMIHVSEEFDLKGKPSYNAVALWVDWDLDGSGESVISTGPIVQPVIGERIQWDMHTRQGVHFLQSKLVEGMYIGFYFSVEDGKITIKFC